MSKITTTPIALTVPFDNSINGFTSTETQSAIEEVKSFSEGINRAVVQLSAKGTVSKNTWITYNELLANPRIIIPFSMIIKEVTWNNNNVNVGTISFEFYENGQLPVNKFFTYTPTALERANGYGYLSLANGELTLHAGDYIYIKHVRTSGGSLSDLALVLWAVRVG